MNVRKVLLSAALALAALTGVAQAQVNVMIPADPGGGWDGTGRQAMQAMNDAGIYTGGVNFSNVGGAGGTIGLAQFMNEANGKPDSLAVFGSITVGAIAMNGSPVNLADFRPIARLTTEYDVLAVRSDSPYKTLQDFVAALKSDPGGTPVGGGSAGGVDQITLALLAKSAGVAASDLNYIPQASGAETVTGIVNGTLTAGISGVSEFAQFAQQGRIRILGITSADRVSTVDAPTFKEAGYDVEVGNWRGFLGAPNMPDDNYQMWVDNFKKLNDSDAWHKVLQTQGWEQDYLGGAAFGTFIADETTRISGVLKDVGLVK
ncbi:MAG TPA: tripartite tricarboxylate transporter substrate-binding protein [Alphaproteobacteria bacterium]|nr:tripartite tricarboxylate transporter substrate-binding protein [Alphaproteobacteria bacterium]